jgi:hypothetical protein
MATNFNKKKLSGSTNGRGIKLVTTTGTGDVIHTATNTANTLDHVTLFATNVDTVARDLVLYLGGTTSPDDLRTITIAAGTVMEVVLPGIPYDGGVVIRGRPSAANVIIIDGEVTQVTE